MNAPPSPFEALPRNVATEIILPYVTSNDLLNFRVASRSCYEIVHDTTDVSHAFCPICQLHSSGRSSNQTCSHSDAANSAASEENESESLWRLALVRDYQFEAKGDANMFHQSFHSPANPDGDAFLSTNDMFTAPNAFTAWKHWRRIDYRLHHRRCVLFFIIYPLICLTHGSAVPEAVTFLPGTPDTYLAIVPFLVNIMFLILP